MASETQEAFDSLMDKARLMQDETFMALNAEASVRTACKELTDRARTEGLLGTAALAKAFDVTIVTVSNGSDYDYQLLPGAHAVTGQFNGFIAQSERIEDEELGISVDQWLISTAIKRPTTDEVVQGFSCPPERCVLVDIEAELADGFKPELTNVVGKEVPSLHDLRDLMTGPAVDDYELAYVNSQITPNHMASFVVPRRVFTFSYAMPKQMQYQPTAYKIGALDYFALAQFGDNESMIFSIAQNTYVPDRLRALDLSGNFAYF